MSVIVREKKKGSGEWWVFINYKGRRRSKKVGNKKAANAVKREAEARLAQGDMGMIQRECPTVAGYGSEWLNSPLRAWSDGTLLSYTDVFERIIKKLFGSKMLSEIKRRHIKQFISELDGLSPSRKRLILAVLSGIFESALDDELVKSNPCRGTQKYCGKLTNKKIVPLTAEEVQNMLENAATLDVVYYAIFFVAVRTGLRTGELLGLKWNDINFEERYLEVNRSFYHKTKSYGPPKNKKVRRVDLTPATVEVLREL
jgi:integrase